MLNEKEPAKMTSLKIVVFPGLEDISYTTEKKPAVQSNRVLEFLGDRASTTHEELYTIEQLSNKQNEAEKYARRDVRNSRQFVCPPILDLSIATPTSSELQQAHKPKRIFNGFFPSKIRTSTGLNTTRDIRNSQELFEELEPDSNKSLCQNGTFLGRMVSRSCPKSEPAKSYSQQSPVGLTHREKKFVYSLRNGSQSPWINRYQLKKSSISSYNAKELRNNSIDISRGFSR